MHSTRQNPTSLTVLWFICSFLVAAPGQAENPTPNPSRVIYDAWFTVTRQEPDQNAVHYQFYNDRMELKNGRMVFQNHLWKKEDNHISEEQVGALAEMNGTLTPQFFNFKAIDGSSEISIDGSFAKSAHSNQTLSFVAKVRKNGSDLTPIRKTLPNQTILSTFFSVWLSTHLSDWKTGSTKNFSAVLENDLESGFALQPGSARLEPADDFAKQHSARKISLQFTGQKSTWWVDKDGVPFRIDFPGLSTTVKRVSEKEAKNFLN